MTGLIDIKTRDPNVTFIFKNAISVMLGMIID
jgi:hypothetical protein